MVSVRIFLAEARPEFEIAIDMAMLEKWVKREPEMKGLAIQRKEIGRKL